MEIICKGMKIIYKLFYGFYAIIYVILWFFFITDIIEYFFPKKQFLKCSKTGQFNVDPDGNTHCVECSKKFYKTE